jgi:hypothetical protein
MSRGRVVRGALECPKWARCRILLALDSAEQHQDYDDHQDRSQQAARSVAPTAAVGP